MGTDGFVERALDSGCELGRRPKAKYGEFFNWMLKDWKSKNGIATNWELVGLKNPPPSVVR